MPDRSCCPLNGGGTTFISTEGQCSVAPVHHVHVVCGSVRALSGWYGIPISARGGHDLDSGAEDVCMVYVYCNSFHYYSYDFMSVRNES